MNGQEQLTITENGSPPELRKPENHVGPPADARQLRNDHVAKLLEKAYAKASTLKLKKEEIDRLRADFPDEAVEVRTESGRAMYYIEHAELRERINSVFHPGEVSEIVRQYKTRSDTNEFLVDLVLLVRGCFVAEAIATVKYYPNSPKANWGDSLESAQSEAYRRCCKHWGVGLQTWLSSWRQGYEERQKAKTHQPEKKVRNYTLKEPTFKEARETMMKEKDEEQVPF